MGVSFFMDNGMLPLHINYARMTATAKINNN